MNREPASLEISMTFPEREIEMLKEASKDELRLVLGVIHCNISIFHATENKIASIFAVKPHLKELSQGDLQNVHWFETLENIFDSLHDIVYGEKESEVFLVACSYNFVLISVDQDVQLFLEDNRGMRHLLVRLPVREVVNAFLTAYRASSEYLKKYRPEIDEILKNSRIERRSLEVSMNTFIDK